MTCGPIVIQIYESALKANIVMSNVPSVAVSSAKAKPFLSESPFLNPDIPKYRVRNARSAVT